MRRKLWLAICLVPALMATSCIYHIGIDVAPGAAAGDPPELTFSHRGHPLTRLDTLTVTGCPDRDVTGAAYVQARFPDLPVLWSIVRDQEPHRMGEVPRITYGRAPAGYRERAPARPLRPGGCYNVYAAGRGSVPDNFRDFGGQTFRLLPDGRYIVGEDYGPGSARTFRELNRAAVGCARAYRRARTQADSAAVDARAFRVMDTGLPCGWLNEHWPDVMSDPQSGEHHALLILGLLAAVSAGIIDAVRHPDG